MPGTRPPLTWGTAWSCYTCRSTWSDSTMYREHCLVRHGLSLGPSTGERVPNVAAVNRNQPNPPGETEDASEYDR